MLVAQLCPTLCDLMDCSPAGSSVHGTYQVIILEWVAISFSGDLPDPGIGSLESLGPPALAGRFFTTSTTWETHRKRSKSIEHSGESRRGCTQMQSPDVCQG